MISSCGKRRREKAGEELVGRNLAPVGDDRGAEAEHAGGIVRRRIGIGERAADRAAVPHLRIADAAREHGERRDGRGDLRRGRDIGMPGHRADGDDCRRRR